MKAVPEISVIVPARNRAGLLRRSIARLASQTLPAECYELIVVDDGSEPPLPEADIAPQGVSFRLFRQPPRGPAAARNRGVAAARGEVIVFTGDDILVPENFLEAHLNWHQRHPSPWEGVIGRVDWPPGYLEDGYMLWLDGSGLQFGYRGLTPGRQLSFHYFYTSNLSAKRCVLAEHPFDEDFPDATHEDTDLGLRLFRQGFRLYFEPACRAEHHHFYTLEQSLAHRRRVGRAGFLFSLKHPAAANHRWIRRPPQPIRWILRSRPYLKIAAFARNLGDPQLMGYYYYLLNSEAFWEGFREAARERAAAPEQR